MTNFKTDILEIFKGWLKIAGPLEDVILIVLIFLFAWIIHLIFKRVILKITAKLIRKSKLRFDDYILESKALDRLTLLVPILFIYNALLLFPFLEKFVVSIGEVLIVFVIVRVITALTLGLNEYYSTLDIAKVRPIKGYVQILNLFIYLIASIFIIASLTGKSPWALLGGLGALTAVLLLIFRDTILSFVASIQIASNDLVHVGDWIEMPKFGADGAVIDIALHTIKVQNWDKTITTIPTYKLIEESFKNWRGMQETGGRRIKRSLFIDLNSISFCDDEMLKRFESINLLKEYLKQKKEELIAFNKKHGLDNTEIVNRRRLTNVGTFRKYVEFYIERHPRVHKGLTRMVRQLAPGQSGLPLEIYCFTDTVVWLEYEAIQSDMFDHILSVVPEFGLRVYQQPAGSDMSRIQFFNQD